MFSQCLPLAEFVRANKQKANVIGWWCRQCLSPANQVAFLIRQVENRLKNRQMVKANLSVITWVKIPVAGGKGKAGGG